MEKQTACNHPQQRRAAEETGFGHSHIPDQTLEKQRLGLALPTRQRPGPAESRAWGGTYPPFWSSPPKQADLLSCPGWQPVITEQMRKNENMVQSRTLSKPTEHNWLHPRKKEGRQYPRSCTQPFPQLILPSWSWPHPCPCLTEGKTEAEPELFTQGPRCFKG